MVGVLSFGYCFKQGLEWLMALKLPAILPSSHYIRRLHSQSGGVRAWTHLAELNNADNQFSRGFVKHFPDVAYRSLFNEYFGYTVMSALGIPQPDAAMIEAPIVVDDVEQLRWAFVSFQPTPTCEGTPQEIYNLKSPNEIQQFITRILSCPSFPLMVAADQLVMNGDRNAGNLVFTSKKSFVVIDHSDILGGPNWLSQNLWGKTDWIKSKPLEEWVDMKSLSSTHRNAIYSAASLIEERFFKEISNLKIALDAKSSQESSDALSAIWWRNMDIVNWFQKRLNILV